MSVLAGPPTLRCLKCGFEQAEGPSSCERCGVIFAKLRTSAEPPLKPAEDPSHLSAPAPVSPPLLPAYDLLLLGGALIAAASAHALPLSRFLLSIFVTLVHEFGHAVAAWLVGCPAVPAFDLMHGGGVTYHQHFEPVLAVAIGAGFAGFGWRMRRRRRALAALLFVGALWLAVVSSDWRREMAIAAAGHGAEILFAGLLLWMALTGVGWRRPEIERPLGAFLAFFVAIQSLSFAASLSADRGALADYLRGKGGMLMNDLESLALDLHIWLGIETSVPELARWMLLMTPASLAIALGLRVFHDPATRALAWLLEEH